MEEHERYNKFSENYDESFKRNIEFFKKAADHNRRYAVFYPSFGLTKHEGCDFLFSGQAVKGWAPIFNTNGKLDCNQLLKKSIEYSNSFYKKQNHNPLDWVNIYWSSRIYNNQIIRRNNFL